MGLRAGLNGCGKSRHHRDSIPRPSARSESLYRLSYRGPHQRAVFILYIIAIICYTNGVWDSSVVYVLDDQ